MAGKRRDAGDGSIYQRKSDGRWIGKYTPSPNAKPKVLYGKSEQEVKRKLRDLRKEVARPDYKEVKKITVQDYMMDWFTTVKINELKAKSTDRTEQSLNNQIFPFIGNLQIGSLTASDIQKMINALVARDYAYETIKKAYNNVNACFKLGIIKGDMTKNPCLGVVLPKKLETKKQDIRFFTKEESDLLYDESIARHGNGVNKYRLGHAVAVLLYTGIRISELLGLKWKNINFAKKTMKIEESIIYVKNRSGDESESKYVLVEQDSVKTGSSERFIPLNKKAIAALEALQKINGTHTHVMATANGTVIGHRNFDRMLRSICKQCNLDPCGAHVLRHTFASMLFRAGVDVKTVSELLGHSDVSVTYNTYIHLIKEQKQQAVDILDEL